MCNSFYLESLSFFCLFIIALLNSLVFSPCSSHPSVSPLLFILPFPLCHFHISIASSTLFCSFIHGRGESIRDERNSLSTQFPTGTLQYLIRSAFVWSEPCICVWVSDKERRLASVCVRILYLYAGKGQEKKDRCVYICVCADRFGMKSFPQSYDNWFSISLSPCLGLLVPFTVSFPHLFL